MESIISSDRFTAVDLSSSEYQRYARHLTIPDVGPDGQRKLKAARVLCIGAGGLGSPAALYLAAAGIGEIGIVDFDRVEFSNLQRQILHDTADVGKRKTESALERLRAINPEVRIRWHPQAITSSRASSGLLQQSKARWKVTVIGEASWVKTRVRSTSTRPSAFRIPITIPSNPKSLQSLMSSFITSNSRSLYRKSPARGRIKT